MEPKSAVDISSWIVVQGIPESGPQQAFFNYAFVLGGRFRVELYIVTGDQARNKAIFDALSVQQLEIEAAFGDVLAWERINKKRASRVAAYHPGSITDSPDQLIALRRWAIDAMRRFVAAIKARAEQAIQAVG